MFAIMYTKPTPRRAGVPGGLAALVRAALMAATIASMAAALITPAATAAGPLTCKSGDLRYPFMSGGPKSFGVFKLRISHGTCATAHSVAKAWKQKFEAAMSAGHLKLPKSVDGFSFKTLPAHEAQTYSEKGTKGRTTITFDYRVPNG
jgi:hypothetical protein